MNYKERSSETYKKFSNLEGNDHIAGDYALEEILRYVQKFNVKNILEVGLGIGSISEAILNFAEDNQLDLSYSGTEPNEYCLTQLPLNVQRFEMIKLYSDLNKITKGEIFDFVIIDGGDAALKGIKEHCSKKAIIFIEGGRASQIATLRSVFPNFYHAEIISIRKPPAYGPFHQKWAGGGTLIAVNPTIYQKAFIFTEKVKTYAKRRMRKYIKE